MQQKNFLSFSLDNRIFCAYNFLKLIAIIFLTLRDKQI